VELPHLIVRDRGGIEKIISLGDDTTIEKNGEELEVSDLSADDFIVVIGTPNDRGMIEAKFIRVIPSPEFLNE